VSFGRDANEKTGEKKRVCKAVSLSKNSLEYDQLASDLKLRGGGRSVFSRKGIEAKGYKETSTETRNKRERDSTYSERDDPRKLREKSYWKSNAKQSRNR